MSGRDITVSTEQLLLPLGGLMVNVNVRLYEPKELRSTLLAFHGFVGNSLDFLPLAQMLGRSGIRVVAPDMLGRGGSVHLEDPAGYTVPNMLQAAAAVLGKYGRDSTVLGMGWGALIALLGLGVARVRPRKLVAVDLPLDFSIEADPVIARAFADRGRVFATSGEAMAHVRTSPEFASLAEDADLTHRIRAEGDHYVLSHDERVTQRTADFGGRDYDLRRVLAGVKAETLLLTAGPASGEVPRNCTAIGGFGPGGRLLLRSPAEQLLVLGFVSSW